MIVKLRELKEVEANLQSALMPGEELLVLGKPNQRKSLFSLIIPFEDVDLCFAAARTFYLDNIFIPFSWPSALRLLSQVIVMAIVIVVVVGSEFRNVEPFREAKLHLEQTGAHFGDAYYFLPWCALALVFCWIVLPRALKQVAFAITDKRIIYLVDSKIKGWIYLDNLSAIEVHKGKKDSNWLTIKFSSRPIGMDGKAASDKQEFYLHDFDEPDLVKDELDELIKSLPNKAAN